MRVDGSGVAWVAVQNPSAPARQRRAAAPAPVRALI